jgi:hypothetical protein
VVKLSFFLFGGSSNAPFDFSVPHDHEVPRLEIGAAGGAAGNQQTFVNDLLRNGATGELTHGTTPKHLAAKMLDANRHFIRREFPVGGEGKKYGCRHSMIFRKHSSLLLPVFSAKNMLGWQLD